MSWWKTAIYDTCSLITLDKILQEGRFPVRCFPKRFLALEASLSADQMNKKTAARMSELIEICQPPPLSKLAILLSSKDLPKSLSEVDRMVFATAVHFGLAVVTGDRQLGKAAQKHHLKVGDMATILKELVWAGFLTKADAITLLKTLAAQKDYLLGRHNPTWIDLEQHTFPG